MLAIWGGADEGIGPDVVQALRRGAWTPPGHEHRTVVYPGAPHSFFDRTAAEHAAASEDAWREVLDFIGHRRDAQGVGGQAPGAGRLVEIGAGCRGFIGRR